MGRNKNKEVKKTPKSTIALPKTKKMAESEEPVKNEEKYLRVAPATKETKVIIKIQQKLNKCQSLSRSN